MKTKKLKRKEFKLKGKWSDKDLKVVHRFLKQFWPVLEHRIKYSISKASVKL